MGAGQSTQLTEPKLAAVPAPVTLVSPKFVLPQQVTLQLLPVSVPVERYDIVDTSGELFFRVERRLVGKASGSTLLDVDGHALATTRCDSSGMQPLYTTSAGSDARTVLMRSRPGAGFKVSEMVHSFTDEDSGKRTQVGSKAVLAQFEGAMHLLDGARETAALLAKFQRAGDVLWVSVAAGVDIVLACVVCILADAESTRLRKN
ncbi:hypothetical protein HK105_204992 [Polyrhizophydium stewartii]|uniref:Uncharacterized protein n=1 Tax=Polyrhizophydium stewartii TaxID=2732419 RepID=A0ABR4N7E0_9FUNG